MDPDGDLDLLVGSDREVGSTDAIAIFALEAQRYSFTTGALETGTYVFLLRQVDYDGAFEYSPEIEVAVGLDEVYERDAATPNPLWSRAEVRLAVQVRQTVRASLYDALGREVAVV